MEITEEDKQLYQDFSEILTNHIVCYTSAKHFNSSIDSFISSLEEVQKNNTFENYIQKNEDLISAVIKCSYRYRRNKDIEVLLIVDFLNWFKSLTKESQQLVLNNLIYKLSSIEEKLPDDIPF